MAIVEKYMARFEVGQVSLEIHCRGHIKLTAAGRERENEGGVMNKQTNTA